MHASVGLDFSRRMNRTLPLVPEALMYGTRADQLFYREVSQREEAKKTVKKTLEERYTSGKNRWFFTPLSMSSLALADSLRRTVSLFVG